MLAFGLVAYFHGDKDRGIGMSAIGAIRKWRGAGRRDPPPTARAIPAGQETR